MMDSRSRVSQADASLVRAIGLGGATALVIGNVLGSGIFLTSGIMAGQMPSAGWLMIAWIAGGALAIAGGLTCAELGAMYPHSGGWYVFLTEAYGPLWGFLFGWAGMLVMLSGAIAAVAVGFAEYLSYFFPALSTTRIVLSLPVPRGEFGISAGQLVAAASLLVLGAVNYVGVRTGNAVQSFLTAVKVLALAALAVLPLMIRRVHPAFTFSSPGAGSPVSSFGVVMIAVIWTYVGWDYVVFAAGEIRRPERNIPRALILGTLTLTVLYIVTNLGYFYALSLDEMQGEVRIAERAVSVLIGGGGAALISAAVMISTFGSNASSILPVTRVAYAMSSDGLFLKSAAAVHPRFRTPHVAIVLTTAWSALLTLSGTYEQLYTYATFTVLLFNVAGGMAIFRLRKIQPDRPRPYRAWGYPLVPLLFVLSTAFLVVNTLVERPVESIGGLTLILLGLPAYRYWNGRRLEEPRQTRPAAVSAPRGD